MGLAISLVRSPSALLRDPWGVYFGAGRPPKGETPLWERKSEGRRGSGATWCNLSRKCWRTWTASWLARCMSTTGRERFARPRGLTPSEMAERLGMDLEGLPGLGWRVGRGRQRSAVPAAAAHDVAFGAA